MTNMKTTKKELSLKQREELLSVLKERFEKNMNRHKGLDWAKVQTRSNPESFRGWRGQSTPD